jgi:hypothetical protein
MLQHNYADTVTTSTKLTTPPTTTTTAHTTGKNFATISHQFKQALLCFLTSIASHSSKQKTWHANCQFGSNKHPNTVTDKNL